MNLFWILSFAAAVSGTTTQVKEVELKDPFPPAIVEEVIEEPEYEWISIKATAYCPCSKCCGKSDGITSSGVVATSGHTIAAPKTYAFGTQMEINGIVYTVEDRGGAIQGNKIDIFFYTHEEARAFGVQYFDAKLYK
jgi:3D (Asp-Asp-Asp) domain-containing protein